MVSGQIDSNGSGKTTIVNALAWCLYGKPISKIAQDKLINNVNKKNMEVTVVFEKDGKYYMVKRYRKHKVLGDTGVRLFEAASLDDLKDDKLNLKDGDKAEANISLTNQQLVRIIDMTYEVFTILVIYSARHEPFFDLPSTSKTGPNQSDIMEELTGLTELSKWADDLDKKVKKNNTELEMVKEVQKEIDRQKERFGEKLNSIKARVQQWEDINVTNIQQTKNKIEELSNIDFDLQKECLEHYNVNREKLKETSTLLDLKSMELTNLQEKAESAHRWVKDQQVKLEQARTKLESLDEVDYASEEEKLVKIETLKSESEVLVRAIKTRTVTTTQNHRRMSEIADELDHLTGNKCPYCLQKFQDAKTKIDDLETEKGTLYGEVIKLDKENLKDSAVVEKNKDDLEQLQGQVNFNSLVALNSHKNQYENSKNEVARLESQVNPYADVNMDELNESIDNLLKEWKSLEKKKAKFATVVATIKEELIYDTETQLINDLNKINVLKDELVKLEAGTNPHTETLDDLSNMKFDEDNYKKIDELEKEILHQKFLYKLLTKKDSFIRKSLLSKSLKFLNERLKDYMGMLGMNHKVKFTEELTAKISQFGNELDFGNLSAGQQARVNLALSFAFKDVLQKRYGKISFCILDECLDVGLGSVGVQMAAKMVKTIAIRDKLSMFIISHKDEIANMFPNVMEIELNKGFSSILKSKLSSTEYA
jgi:DNA repair exonuclease SbcCD ATPase subunit